MSGAMNWPVLAACLWLVVANVIGMLPSKDHHWSHARWLIAALVPLAAWVFWTQPWWLGLALLAAAASTLRWPVYFGWRWLRRRLGPKASGSR
ncbi:DUF2484 family protein [Pseudoroseicyclus sp. H15]